MGASPVSDYKWVSIGSAADYDDLIPLLDRDFDPNTVVNTLRDGIRGTVAGVLVEREYIDKDYRSTFYQFYAKKGRTYRDDCVRLHFFDAEVAYDDATTSLTCSDDRLEDHYFGFAVLRPTLVATRGRSILTPDIRAGARGRAIQAQHRVHLLGHRLPIWGFPSMSQHNDISVCAHVSCWAILRHYSERYPQHRELLLHDITMMASPFDPGGITPAFGLNILQAERIFQAAGTYPVIVGKVPGEEERFYAQMLAYLESGFPLFAAMTKRSHAIVLAGYAWANPMTLAPFGASHAWSQVESLLVVDDNLLPYESVPASPPPAAAGAATNAYTAADIDAFIVPLPDKIFYPATAIERHSLELYRLLKASGVKLPPEDRLIRRYFMTTIAALRRFAWDRRSELGTELVNMLMRLRTAQFVWIVEYASDDQWRQGQIAARAIIDATASPRDPIPVWFSHDLEEAIHFDRGAANGKARRIPLKRQQDAPMGRMEQNLRPVR
jgi:hypothetical protein